MPDLLDEPAPGTDPILEDPRLLPFLPMLYVAWADGDLEAAEMQWISDSVSRTADLDEASRSALVAWLDPEAPPSAERLHRLLAAIRRIGKDLPRPERLSLAQLGLALSRAVGREPDAGTAGALADLEASLGLAAVDVGGSLLPAAADSPALAPAPSGPPYPEEERAALTRLLDGEHREIRQRVRRLLALPEFAYLREPARAAYREQVYAWCRRLAEEGLGSLAMPAAYGGGGDAGAFIAVFETLAHHDLSLLVKFGVQFGLFGGAIQQLGTEPHHLRYLRAAGRLELAGCFAMTETGHGSNVQALETTATYEPASGDFVLETPHRAARKDYIGNAGLHGQVAVVFAQLLLGGETRGVHAFVVPIRDAGGHPLPGLSIEDCGPKVGLDGVDNGRLSFEAVRVPRENLLNRFADVAADGTYSSPIASPNRRFFTMVGTLVGGRISVALAAVSAAKSALTIATRYGLRRRQFGREGGEEKLLLDHLTHQRRLLPPLAATYGLHFALRRLAERYAANPGDNERREAETAAAGLKAVATWHAARTIQVCREACGGQGYLAENRFGALRADTDVFTTFEGDNTVLLQLVAKALLADFRQELGDLNLIGIVRMVARRAGQAWADRNPLVAYRKGSAHLRDPSFQGAILRSRQEHLVTSLARRLQARIGRGMNPFDALGECQDHALEAAHAYVDRLVFEGFEAALQGGLDPALRPRLVLLQDLFALERLERHRSWYLEHGFFETAKAAAIRSEVGRLCGELRPHARILVDAFAIPAELLAAPIAIGRP
jgi:acyl-CoA oxidase